MHVYDMRHWKAITVALAALVVIVPVARYLTSDAQAAHAKLEHGVPTNPDVLDPPALHGIDLTRMAVGKVESTAPASKGRTAHLSIDPDLQRTVQQLFLKRAVTEGSVVMMDLRSGRLMVYASINEGVRRDVNVEAKAPAASIFKIVTGTGLVEAGVPIDHKECYRGGLSGFDLSDLIEDEVRDKWCATVAGAMGRSLNVIMGRLALRHLDPESLGATARGYGFGAPIPFDVPVEPSTVVFAEDDDLRFARTAAGFWNTTLSPMQGLMIAATVAQRGVVVRPVLVNSVTNEKGDVIYRAPAAPQKLREAFKPETAEAVGKMMEETFTNGTAHADFYDSRGRSYLPNIKLAGKTGTLTNRKQRFFTWLVGYAGAEEPEVAYAVLVNNGPNWRTKAPFLTREVLRAYFAGRGAPGVSAPSLK
jgi:cell division protein FtsI/penicillin-binding protein 2